MVFPGEGRKGDGKVYQTESSTSHPDKVTAVNKSWIIQAFPTSLKIYLVLPYEKLGIGVFMLIDVGFSVRPHEDRIR